MSTDETEELQHYASLMVQREITRWGDQENAVRRCADRCGLSESAFKHVYSGRTKSPGMHTYHAIRSGYLSQLDEMIATLTAERAREIQKTELMDDVLFHEEIESLRARLDSIISKLKGE